MTKRKYAIMTIAAILPLVALVPFLQLQTVNAQTDNSGNTDNSGQQQGSGDNSGHSSLGCRLLAFGAGTILSGGNVGVGAAATSVCP
jgi:hypothetical protein